MKRITSKTLMRKLQKSINDIQKIEAETFKEKIDKARTIGYLCSVCSQVIEKHENEKRIDELEETLNVLLEQEERKLTA